MSLQSAEQAPAKKKPDPEEIKAEIGRMMETAREAQVKIANYTQDEADALVTAVGWHVFKDREALAQLAVDEGGFGNTQDKIAKFENRILGTLVDMSKVKTCGVVEEDAANGIIKIAKPVGVIAALIPTTGPDATPPVNALSALKARNAIIIAPHPRTKGTSIAVVEAMRRGCEQVGAPADLIQVIETPSIAKTQELMEQADVIVATGGAGMVTAAYSSGTPAYGVGVGNSVHVVDETSDVEDAANMIARAKTFDYASSCLADNSIVAHADVYDKLNNLLQKAGGHVCSVGEKAKLLAAMWPDGGHIPTIAVIAKSAQVIADLAGINLPEGKTFLIVEEDGVGHDHPFSGEKLSVVLTLYKYDGAIQAAVEQVNAITDFQGLGHTCGIHTSNDANVDALALGTKTARVVVNQNLNEAAGSPRNGMPYTLSLSCGSWGGNITTENVNVRHFMNLTWVTRPIEPRQITAEGVFSGHWDAHGRD